MGHEQTSVFHILMSCSQDDNSMVSSSDHATHPTGNWWSCRCRCNDISGFELGYRRERHVRKSRKGTQLSEKMLTPTDQTMTLLSLLALARNFPLWLHSRLHTSSVCTCSIVVVMRGKRSVSHVWSAYKEKC